MFDVSSTVISKLDSLIQSLPACPAFADLIYHPSKNFTRNSKFGLLNTVHFVFGAGPTTLKNELRSFLPNDACITPGALVQSRSKIKPDLFRHLFFEFNKLFTYEKTFKNYRLFAVDGCILNIPYNPKDLSTLHKGRSKDDGSSGKGYNQLHLTAAYDILNSCYVDAVIKDITLYNEPKAAAEIVSNCQGGSAIFIIDRGFEGANLFEYLNQNTKFIARVKDINCKNGLMRGLVFPSDNEFDIDVNLTFTNYNRKEYQNQKHKYKIIQKYQEFDHLDENTHFYETTWRVVRFRIEDGYETIVTNLDRDEFSAEDIKYLYNLRWNIEVSYRYLKHDIHLTSFISRKKEFIYQEIWAKLTMYNVTSLITNRLEEKRENRKKKKHIHKINYSNACHLIREAFKGVKRKGGVPPDLDNSIIKDTSPVRPGRKFARSPYPHSYRASNYRIY